MLKMVVSIFLTIVLLSSCASVTTKSTYEGIKAPDVVSQKPKCVVRVGTLANHDGIVKVSSDPQMSEYKELKSIIESDDQFRRVCKDISFENVDNFEIEESKVVEALALKKHKRDIPSYTFYRVYPGGTTVGQDYFLWSGVYVLSLGLIPVGFPSRAHFWVVKHEPYELKGKVLEVNNSGWTWYWSPFYLFPNSKVSRTNADYDRRIHAEALIKALRGVTDEN